MGELEAWVLCDLVPTATSQTHPSWKADVGQSSEFRIPLVVCTQTFLSPFCAVAVWPGQRQCGMCELLRTDRVVVASLVAPSVKVGSVD